MNESVYLASSNRRPKYFEDCVHALMLPRGTVMHFRYLVKHLSPGLRQNIEASPRQVEGALVVVSYYCQQPTGGTNDPWKPVAIYPLRLGEIARVDYTGAAVHLYFRLLGYPKPSSYTALIAASDEALKPNGNISVASFGKKVDQGEFSSDDQSDDEAFTAIVDSFEQQHFVAYEEIGAAFKPIQLDPMFARVSGIYRSPLTSHSRSENLNPTDAGFSALEKGYLLSSDRAHSIEVGFHLPGWTGIPTKGYALSLETDKQFFSNPEREDLRIGSPYDKGRFFLVPSKSERGWISRAVLSLSGVKEEDKKVTPFATWEIWCESKPKLDPRLAKLLRSLSALLPLVIALLSAGVALSSKNPKLSWNVFPTYFWIVLAFYALVLSLNGLLVDSSKT